VKILSFAGFGFAESHSLSFALLVYASSWFKLHYPAAFLAGLLRNQPMGFYSPQSLVADARRHGVEVRRPDIVRSGVQAGLEPVEPNGTDRHRYDDGLAVRLGLDSVKGIGSELAERIVTVREEAPYSDIRDLSRRAGLTAAQLEALATAGAFDGFGLDRRQALWMAGYSEHDGQLPGSTPTPPPPMLPGMSAMEVTLADLWATRISTDVHPIQHYRTALAAAGVRAVGELVEVEPGRRVHVAGLVTHRQRPGTAGGVTFLNLEDETGMLNVICSQGVMRVHRQAARNKVAVVIRGKLERQDGVTNLVADRVEPLDTVLPGTSAALQARQSSRDFR
jgi:error-prone DNA polymerase